MLYLTVQRGDFQKLYLGSETLGMTSEGLGEMFEGDGAVDRQKVLVHNHVVFAFHAQSRNLFTMR